MRCLPDPRVAGISVQVIGRIRTPFVQAKGTPIQPAYAGGAEGQVFVDEPYASALDDIDGFERIWLIYWMDRAMAFEPRVVPYRDTWKRGLFSTRSPSRPNPIGLSAVRLTGRDARVLRVADIDVLDGTPLIDIKPYVPEFDAYPSSKAGWLGARRLDRRVADERFHEDSQSTRGVQPQRRR